MPRPTILKEKRSLLEARLRVTAIQTKAILIRALMVHRHCPCYINNCACNPGSLNLAWSGKVGILNGSLRIAEWLVRCGHPWVAACRAVALGIGSAALARQ